MPVPRRCGQSSGWRSISTIRGCGSSTAASICRDRAAILAPSTRPATFPAPCSSTSTTSATPPAALPHMLPPPNVFVEKVQALGIGDGDHIIVYDQPGSCAATRVWWTFRAFGHHEVGVLDGGLAKWLAAGLPVTDQPPRPRQASLTARFDPSLVRSAADVLSSLGDPGIQIIDNRPAGRYAGRDPEPRPARRVGHVPGSRNLPFSSFLDAGRHGAGGRPTNSRHCSRKQASISRSRS